MEYTLHDIIDMEHFQNLQDRLNEIYSFPSAIIDNEGNILTATAWQDVCTKFHRQNKDSELHCIQSDRYILSHLHEANPAVSYRCPHGLVDNVTPIIVDGIHYGNFFTGQFFLEKPDMDFFRTQAKKYGFDEDAYLDAVKKVPVWSQETLNSYLYFIKELITLISESGLKKLKEIEARKHIEETEARASKILEEEKRIEQRKLAIDSVREKIWMMKTSDDIKEVAFAIRNVIEKFIATFHAFGLNLVNAPEDPRNVTVYEIAHNGSMLSLKTGPAGEKIILDLWKKGTTAYRKNIGEEDIYKESGHLDINFNSRIMSVIDVPFSHGTLAINSEKADAFTQQDIEFLEDMAKILSEGFKRTEDLKQLEKYIDTLEIDITARKRVEVALRESDEKYRGIFENVQDVFYESTIDGYIVNVSPSVDKLSKGQYRRDDVIGKSMMEFYANPGDREDILELLRNQGSVSDYEITFINRDGSIVPCSISANIQCDAHGEPVKIIGSIRDITERKRAEEALHLNTARLRSLVDIFQYKTGATQEFLDYALAKALNLTRSKIGYIYFYNEDKKQFILNTWSHDVMKECAVKNPRTCYDLEKTGVWGEAVRQRKPIMINNFQQESLLFKGYPEGHVRLNNFMTVPVFSGERIVAVVGVANKETNYEDIDILQLTLLMDGVWKAVERIRTDNELRESEEKHRRLFESMTQGVVYQAVNDEVISANPAAERILGLSIDQLKGKTSMDPRWKAIREDGSDLPGTEHPSMMALRTGKPVERFIMGVMKPEESMYRWISVSAIPFFRPGEMKPFQVYTTFDDITEQRRAEQKYQTLFREMLDGFALHEIILDEAGKPSDYRFLAINPAFERMTGLKADETIGRTALEVMPGLERDWIESYGKVALTGEPVFFENYSTEMKKHFEVTAYRPAPNQFACIFSDITVRKRAEAEREKLESQLLQAQKMEAVGRLAGGVAHDFNNMLSIIIGHTELALGSIDSYGPLHDDLQEIHNAAKRSADLTRQLLAFARKQTISPKALDLNDTVEGMLKMLRRLIGEDIDLAWNPGRDIGTVWIDPSQIDQILANLCVNARDAITDVGKVTIETANKVFNEAYCDDHAGFTPGEYVLLAVSDNGCGMDKETLSIVFEPFYTTKEKGKGTGLGLATVYGIVKQNDGFINVYSEPGEGTTFTIYLPRYGGKTGQAAMKDPSKFFTGGSETILLVEDEPSILKLGKKILEKLGYTILSANTPGEAIRLADDYSEQIHLLITDVVMPEMNGRDLSNTLMSRHPHLKCLFMSGYTADVIAHHGVLDENVHFIQKPFSIQALAAKVRAALSE